MWFRLLLLLMYERSVMTQEQVQSRIEAGPAECNKAHA
jgi:hypothetical protein